MVIGIYVTVILWVVVCFGLSVSDEFFDTKVCTNRNLGGWSLYMALTVIILIVCHVILDWGIYA